MTGSRLWRNIGLRKECPEKIKKEYREKYAMTMLKKKLQTKHFMENIKLQLPDRKMERNDQYALHKQNSTSSDFR